ncbi:MAG: uroporphyrinogen-III C-methyltransferase [Candidatus Omnitrophica bacterium CG1_02_46_14]|nr:MAG: uroporphyrinogen-III C-methyltransferase [Candidatus Omnitrophica bacterium CG1_02_46_14]
MSKLDVFLNPSVSLVGTGPGDPELLTIKALKRIQEADLIIYDYLVNPDHLRHAKPSAAKICVGKGFRYERLSQDKINRLIIRSARNGKKVVRLKGGDPYLFGRGGEEALYLQEHRISFEVVPGVTSAIACAAYSGIPLTHRKHNASVTFLTGHRADDENLDSVDWQRIVALEGTIVVYMGFYNLGKIAKRLMNHGMSQETKVCVIQWGTLPWQKSCQGTLRTIEAVVAKEKLGAPAIIIIGDVVSLKDKLNWFEKLPLFGKKILITRMREKAQILKDKLSSLGAWVFELPTLEIKPVDNFTKMDEAIRNIRQYDWLVFASTYGVDAFFSRLKNVHHKDGRSLAGIKIASVGTQTSQALKKEGLIVDLEPKRFETQAIIEALQNRLKDLKQIKILLVRTNIAPPELEMGLKKLGAQVSALTAYQTKNPKRTPANLKREYLRGSMDYVTFTSASTVSNFIKLLGLKNIKKLSKTRFASIGPVTSKTLTAHGLAPACQAKKFTSDGLIHAIICDAKKWSKH